MIKITNLNSNYKTNLFQQPTFKGGGETTAEVIKFKPEQKGKSPIKPPGCNHLRPQVIVSKGMVIKPASVTLPSNRLFSENIIFPDKRIIIGLGTNFQANNNKFLMIKGKEIIAEGNNAFESKILAENDITLGKKSAIDDQVFSENGNIFMDEDSYISGDLTAKKDINISNDNTILASIESKEGKVVIGEKCQVLGKIEAKDVYIGSFSTVSKIIADSVKIDTDCTVLGGIKAKKVELEGRTDTHLIVADSVTLKGLCDIHNIEAKEINIIHNKDFDGKTGKDIKNITTKQEELVLEGVNLEKDVRFTNSTKSQILRIKPGTKIGGHVRFENGKGTVIVEKGAKWHPLTQVYGGKLLDMSQGIREIN